MAVVVEGYQGLRKALKELAPNLAREMDREIRSELIPIVEAAEAKVPAAIFGAPDNWSNYVGKNTNAGYFPQYDAGEIRRGLTYSLGRQKKSKMGYVSMITLLNKNPAGAIAEQAGKIHPYGRPQYAQRFTKYGTPYRIRGSRQSLSDNPDAGRMMIDRLNERMGPLKNYKSSNNKRTEGRLLYAAYAENQGKALDAIMKAIETARTKFNQQSVLYDMKQVA